MIESLERIPNIRELVSGVTAGQEDIHQLGHGLIPILNLYVSMEGIDKRKANRTKTIFS
jgi:hypothetical protein